MPEPTAPGVPAPAPSPSPSPSRLPAPAATALPVGTVRASSWPELFDCALRWYARNVLDLRLPVGPRTRLGTALHAGTAVLDTARLQNATPDPEAALATALAALHPPPGEDELHWTDDEFPPEAAEPVVRHLLAAYASATAPETLAAVELTCPPLDVATPRGVVRLTGTVDRLRVLPSGQLAVRDLKSGTRVVALDGTVPVAKHFMQTGVYRLLAAHALGTPVDGPSEILALETVREMRLGLGPVPDELPALLGRDGHPGLLELAADTLATGLFRPNPASRLCHPGGCPYHSRCPYHA